MNRETFIVKALLLALELVIVCKKSDGEERKTTEKLRMKINRPRTIVLAGDIFRTVTLSSWRKRSLLLFFTWISM